MWDGDDMYDEDDDDFDFEYDEDDDDEEFDDDDEDVKREIARDEKIAFIMWAILDLDDVVTELEDYDDKTDAELDEMAMWYDHLLEFGK